MQRGLKDKIGYVIGYIPFTILSKIFDWIESLPRVQICTAEKNLRKEIRTMGFLWELMRHKLISIGIPEPILQTVSLGIDELRYGIDWETLRESFNDLSGQRYSWTGDDEFYPKNQSRKEKLLTYLEILKDLDLYRKVHAHRLGEWNDLYMTHHGDSWIVPGHEITEPGLYHLSRNTRIRKVSTDNITVPAMMYFRGEIEGYPKTTTIPDTVSSTTRNEQKIRPEPWFYGEEGDVCTVRYYLKGVEAPAESLIQDIQQFYADMGWKPLAYEAASPYRRGSLYAGWKNNYTWSQCWISPEEDIARVLMENPKRDKPCVRIYVTFVPHRYTKETLRCYDRLHGSREVTGEVPLIPPCPYEEFPVFPFPPLGTGLPEGAICFESLITGQYKRNLGASRGLFAYIERKTENGEKE